MKKILTFLYLILAVPLALSKNPEADTMHRYIWANYNQFAGNKDVAYKCYQEIFKTKHPPFVYKGYIHLLFNAGQYKGLVQLMSKAEPLAKNDPEIGLIFAIALENTGNVFMADERFIALNDKFKHNQETTFYAVNAYIRRKEPENALKIIDTFLNKAPRKPNYFVFYFLKSQIYAKLAKYPQALENIQSCLELQPAFDKGWLMLALLQENEGRLTEAIKGYNTFLEVAGSNQEVEQHVLQLAFQQSLQKTQPTAAAQSPLQQALALNEKKEYKAALDTLQKFLNDHPKNHEARILYVQTLTAMKEYKKALSLLKEWIVAESENAEWFKILSLLPRSGAPYADVIGVLASLRAELPNNLFGSLYLADMYMRTKKFNNAVETLEQSLTLTQDAGLKVKILFQLGLLHYELGSFGDVKRTLEQGNSLGVPFPPLYNLLAYYYTTKEKDFPKAQQFIALALRADKYNPHFLDTKALVLYNQKKYPTALKILQKLSVAEPTDFTIQKHLGKTYYKMGKYKEAMQTCQKAQTLATNERERKDNEKFLTMLQRYEKK